MERQHDCLTCATPLAPTRGTFCGAACREAWVVAHPAAAETRTAEPRPFATASVPDATAERLAQWTVAMDTSKEERDGE